MECLALNGSSKSVPQPQGLGNIMEEEADGRQDLKGGKERCEILSSAHCVRGR